MSVADELTALSTNISSAYDAIETKGGTIPANKNTENLATAIGTISGGATKDYGTLTMADYTFTLASASRDISKTSIAISDATKAEKFLRDEGMFSETNYNLGYGLFDGETHDLYVSFQSRQNYEWQVLHSDGMGGYSGKEKLYTEDELRQNGINIVSTNVTTSASCVGIALDLTFTGTTHNYEIDNLFDYYSLGTLITSDKSSSVDAASEVLLDFHGITYYKDAIRGFTFGPDADFIPNEFLDNAAYFNAPLTIPSGITVIPDGFLENCASFNSTITIPSSVTEIGDNFMFGCIAFNQPLNISSVTKIGSYFMAGELNQQTGVPAGLCYNQPLDLSNVTWIGGNFMQYSTVETFAYTYDFSSVVHLGGHFFSNTKYNKPIDLSSCIFIGEDFLYQNKTFNSNITLNQSGVDIGTYFLYGAETFNKPIQAEYIKSLGHTAFVNCKAFNQPLNFSQLKILGSSFLQNCIAFNSLVEFPVLERIEMSAFNGCSAYNQPLTIPATVTYITFGQFLYNANNYANTITVETDAVPTSGGTSVISTTTQSAPMYQAGVTIKGAGRTIWLNLLPNRTSSPYRKLINGGE